MSELRIQRNRGFAVARRQTAGRAEKTAGSQPGREKTGLNVSETLRQLLTRAGQAEQQIRESRRTLQTGESALAAAGDSLERMAETARQAAAGGDPDALQTEFHRLAEEIDRILSSAVSGGTRLFLDGEGDGADGLLAAIAEASSGGQPEKPLPDWLAEALGQKDLTPEKILSALGLDQSAGAADILAALMDRPLENGGAAAYLAALYLGSVIAGAPEDPAAALEGLGRLLEKMGEGLSVDEAVEELTHGTFTSLEDFQAQFTGGTAPGMETFMTNLLLTGETVTLMDLEALLALLSQMGRMDLDMALLSLLDQLELHQTLGAGPEPEPMNGRSNPAAAEEAAGGGKTAVLDCGPVRVLGRDLSAVSWEEGTGVLTVRATAVLLGTGEELPVLRLAGGGTVTLQNVRAAVLHTDGQSQAAVFGRNVLGEIRMGAGAGLTLEGGGFVRIGGLRGGASNTLRLTGGGIVLAENPEKETPPVHVVLEGPVSLAAGSGAVVSGPKGAALKPFDVIWKTLLPGWAAVTSMEAGGRQVKTVLLNGDPARLWLDRGDRGAPVHVLVLRGRDANGQPKTRYAYLHWNQHTGCFEECSMYPNPFAVTGGEAGRDWTYEEHTHTLCIRSSRVTGISGGRGTDSNQTPFSGRIALDDGIGTLALALGGVVCRVSQGRAFSLGRGNDVTLTLESGSRNLFESGEGCAGLSLGEGTSLRIDRGESAGGGRTPEGSLTAIGRGGGAGIGRDSGGSRDQTSRILIRGGAVTAAGHGGGAGIGAGKNGTMGPVTILGGTVESTGEKGGGAGIGGGLGAAVGSISIQGGKITAMAAGHAAAIGAGVQGACGDIRIAGTARIVKALGGDPGADIGACLFGGCGTVQVSADIGNARLRTRSGVSLKAGEHTVTLPQFRLSAAALGLARLSLATREEARAAQAAIDAGRRWVAGVQSAYGALYDQLGGSGSLWPSAGGGLLRNTVDAGALLRELREAIALQTPGLTGGEREQVRQLLR